MHIKTAKVAMDSGVRRNPTQYYWCKKYDLMNIANEDYLILKKNKPKDPTIRVVPMEQYFDILMEVHKRSGHGGRDKMLYAIKNKLYIQKRAIEIFVSFCPICESLFYFVNMATLQCK
ncbi:hypothetical protein ABMA27_008955 [Loxostege sticticalis]|uniref:Integrase zinc-binding domain-containing protein n=1 Tax=Loxostege sticticalis TaxID=481309 RepID=A0ABR3H9D9_LOXSC